MEKQKEPKISTTEKQKERGFQLERSVIVAFGSIQTQLYWMIKQSKYTMGELAKLIKMDRTTFTNKFKNASWEAKELYEFVEVFDDNILEVLGKLKDEDVKLEHEDIIKGGKQDLEPGFEDVIKD